MSELLTEPWPWWLGAPALALLGLSIWVLENRLLGISGSFNRLVTKQTAADAQARKALSENPEALDDAMVQATIEEFGQEAVDAMMKDSASAAPVQPSTATPSLPRSVHAVFLLMIVVGGVLGATLAGGVELRENLGPTYTALIGDGWTAAAVLLLGGTLVGFGTRMSGGCTSGHGLSGCSRFQPGSMLATASFFGVGAAVSFALAAAAG